MAVPTRQAEADCIRILADQKAGRLTHDAARLVIHAAQTKTAPPRAAVLELMGYMQRQQQQTRWGT